MKLDFEVRTATIADVKTIHDVTMAAFEEYRDTLAPSSALAETPPATLAALMDGGQRAAIGFIHNVGVAVIRFSIDEGLHFSRLSVLPEYQGRGIATGMLVWLEEYARQHGETRMWCQVRKAVARNVYLYESRGYIITREETYTRPNGVEFQVLTMEKNLSVAKATAYCEADESFLSVEDAHRPAERDLEVAEDVKKATSDFMDQYDSTLRKLKDK